MKKKILSVLLAVVMLVGLLPAGIAEAANTLPATVTAISTNTTVSGSMKENEYGYRFDLASNGYISLNFNRPNISGGSWTLELWDGSLSTVYTLGTNDSEAVGVTSGHIGLPAGRYYLVLRGTYNTDGAAFSLKVNYTASGNWETERNNTQGTADELPVGGSVYGSLMTASDKDVYVFEAMNNKAFRLSVESGFTGTSDSVWKVTVTPANAASRTFTVGGNQDGVKSLGILNYLGGACFVTVESANTYSGGDYKLILEALDGMWESEPNDSQGDAMPIGPGETFYGSGSDGTYDFFDLDDAAGHGVTFHFSGISQAKLVGPDTSVVIEDGMTYGLADGDGHWFLVVTGAAEEYSIRLKEADPYELEPNNNSYMANELPVGAAVYGNTYDSSQDWFHVSPTTATLQFHGVTGYLLDTSSGAQIPVYDGKLIGVRGGADYYLCVQGPANYQLLVEAVNGIGEQEGNNSGSDATPLNIGQTLQGRMDYSGDEDWYAFNAEATRASSVRVMPACILLNFDHDVVTEGTGTWTVRVYGPNTGVDFSRTLQIKEPGGVLLDGFAVPPGQYYVRVTGSGVIDKDYHLTVAYDDAWWQQIDNSIVDIITSPEQPGNSTFKGSLISSGSVSSSCFIPEADGVLNLNFTHKDLGVDETGHYYWTVTLYDEAQNVLKAVSYAGSGTGGDWPSIGVKGGEEYYIAVTTANSNYWSDSVFTVTPNFTADDSWEQENNGSYDDAREMDVDTDVHGTYMYNGDKDYFRFTMPQDGGIFPWFTHEVKEGSTAKWTVELRNENHDLLRTWTYTAGENSYQTQEGVGLAGGDYYLTVTGDNASVQAGLTYTLQAHLDPSPWENELNNTMSVPSPLALNTTTKGSLSTAADVDWYYIDTDESGVLRMSFNHPDLGVDESGHSYWKVTLYTATAEDYLYIRSYVGSGTGGQWGPIGLRPGTWLVKVECASYNSSTTYYNGGTYTLTTDWTADGTWEDERNAGYDNARELPLDTPVHGTYMYSAEADYFHFTMPKNGGIYPYFSHDVKAGATGKWFVTLRDSEHNDIRQWAYTAGEESYETQAGQGLAAGEYYLIVSGNDAPNMYDLVYTLTAHLDDALWEEENNNTRDTAFPLEPDIVGDVTVKGSLVAANDADYFKLAADKPGYLRIHFNHPDLGVDATGSYWRVTLMDSTGAELASHNYTGKLTDTWAVWDEIGLKKGDWFIRVDCPTLNNTTTYYCGDTYELGLEWVTGLSFEQEWNNSFDTATEMTVGSFTAGVVGRGSLMPGSLMSYGDADYYKFTMDKDGGLYLQMFYEQVENSTAGWALTLYDEQHTELLTRYFYQKDEADLVRDEGIGLTAGDYFVKIVYRNSWTSKPYELQFDRSGAEWEAESNNSRATANALITDTDIKGTLKTANDADYFKLTADEPGYFRIHFTHPDLGVDATSYYWRVAVLDSTGTELTSRNYQGKGTDGTWDEIGVGKGTWYIRVDCPTVGNSTTYYDKGTYTMKVDWVTGIPFEQEWNNSFATATEMTVNKLMSASLMTYGDADYFTFTLTEDSGLYLQMFYQQVADSSAGWQLTLYDDQHAEILTRYFYEKNEADLIRDDGIGLPAGTYFAKVSYTGGWTPHPYELQFDASSAKWEQEKNDTRATATTLPHNTEMYGSLATGSDTDYYKLVLPLNSGVTLSFTHPDLGVDATTYLWTVSLRDASGNTVDSASYWGKGTGSTWTTAGLAAGTWYVSVERYSTNSSSYYNPGVYRLKADVDVLTYREKESNDTKETATALDVNRTVTGNRMTSGDTDWYRLDLEDNGFLTLCVGHDTVDTSSTCWKFELLDESEQVMTTLSPMGSSPSGLTSQGIGLTAGTYYVKVSAANTWFDVPYTLEAQFSTEGLWESEYNNTFGTADTLPLSQTIHGNLMTGTDADYYTFQVTQPGYVELCFAHASTGDSNTKWAVTLYDAERASVISYNFAGNGAAFRSGGLGLSQGTYFLAVTRYSTNSSSYYSDYVYDLTADFHAAYDWEEESNNTRETANLIEPNTPVHGSLMTSGDTDYYFFEVGADDSVALSLTHPYIDSTSTYWTARLYAEGSTSALATLSSQGYKEGEVTGTAVAVSAGVYYVAVTSGTHSTKTYTLNVRTYGAALARILSHPEDAVVSYGQSARFTVDAAGAGLKYQWEYSSNEGSTWRPIGTNSATLARTATTANDGWLFHCKVTDSWGNTAVSGAARLILSKAPIVITSQPEDVTAALDEQVTFTISATGDLLRYQWQYSVNDGATWRNVGGDSTWTSVTASVANDGRLYRCVVTDIYENSVVSAEARLTLDHTQLAVISQPEDATAALGDTVTFTVEATGDDLVYQWTYSANGGATWRTTGTNSPTLSRTVTAAMDGWLFRCTVTDAYDDSVTTRSALFTLAQQATLEIISQPADFTGPVGTTASFTVEAEGEGLAYQWQTRVKPTGSWNNSNATGSKTATLSIPVTAARDGYAYRCIITDASGNTVTTEPAILHVEAAPTIVITAQPADFTGAVGATASFTVAAEGEGLTYQWQTRTKPTGSWNNSNANGSKTETMKITVTAARDGYQYRCIITDIDGNTATTEPATLHVAAAPAIVITGQPEDFTGAVGATASFTVAAQGEGLTYQWQTRTKPTGSWNNSNAAGSKTETMSITVTAARDGYQYRCVITDIDGNTATTEPATLHVGEAPAIVITAQPEDFTGAVGETATFTVAATGNGLTYQWQIRVKPTGSWNVSNSTGNKTETLKIPVTAARDGYAYRCVITDAEGNTVTTEPATLHVG